MTIREKENVIFEKLVNDLYELDKDSMDLLTEDNTVFDDPEKIKRWRISRNKFNKLREDFDDLLLVRSGRKPAFNEDLPDEF